MCKADTASSHTRADSFAEVARSGVSVIPSDLRYTRLVLDPREQNERIIVSTMNETAYQSSSLDGI